MLCRKAKGTLLPPFSSLCLFMLLFSISLSLLLLSIEEGSSFCSSKPEFYFLECMTGSVIMFGLITSTSTEFKDCFSSSNIAFSYVLSSRPLANAFSTPILLIALPTRLLIYLAVIRKFFFCLSKAFLSFF